MKEMEYFCNYYIYKDGDKYYIEQDEDLIFNSSNRIIQSILHDHQDLLSSHI